MSRFIRPFRPQVALVVLVLGAIACFALYLVATTSGLSEAVLSALTHTAAGIGGGLGVLAIRLVEVDKDDSAEK